MSEYSKDINFMKQVDPVSGFITKPPESFNTTYHEIFPDLNYRWSVLRERFGPEWRWYEEKWKEIPYHLDKYGFRNEHNPDDLEDGYILLCGQSMAEGTGCYFSDSIANFIEEITCTKVYVAATNALDSFGIFYNTMTALSTIKAKPSHILYLPTSPQSHIFTQRTNDGRIINTMDYMGHIKQRISLGFDVDMEWLVNAMDFHRSYFENKHSDFVNDMCLQMINQLDIPSTFIDMAPSGNALSDEYNIEIDGNKVTVDCFPTSEQQVFLTQLHHKPDGHDDYKKVSMKWLNTRSRDLLHTGPELNRKIAKAVCKTIQ